MYIAKEKHKYLRYLLSCTYNQISHLKNDDKAKLPWFIIFVPNDSYLGSLD